jgi:hypothetical protein
MGRALPETLACPLLTFPCFSGHGLCGCRELLRFG